MRRAAPSMGKIHRDFYPVPLSSPSITNSERAAVLSVLDSPSLSLGPRVQEFEERIAERTGVRYAVAVNSGTSGLHLCVKAAGIQPADEVITTPFSFVASANCVLFERGMPVFVDIDPATLNMDAGRIEAAITPRTRAILAVHVFGRPCPMDPILEIASRHGLAVIEDSCEALGASYHGRPVGSFGQTGVFAFYPNKQITTGEGGVIVTDEAHVAALCRSWRNQGRGEPGGWLQHERIGYNYRLSDLNCALGSAQLARLDEIVSARAAHAARYTALLRDRVPEVIPPAAPAADMEISWFVYVVRLRDEFTREDRDEILDALRKKGIGCSNYFSPIHLQPFYREQFGYQPGDFPATEFASDRTIALPFFTDLSGFQIEFVVEALRETVREAGSRLTAGVDTQPTFAL